MMFVDMKDGSSMSWNTDWVSCVTFGENNPGEETTVAGVVNSAAFTVKGGMLFVNSCNSAAVQLCSCDGSRKYNLYLNGVSLANGSGAAINSQCKKRARVFVNDGTVNTHVDAPIQ